MAYQKTERVTHQDFEPAKESALYGVKETETQLSIMNESFLMSKAEMMPVEPDGGTGASDDFEVLGIEAMAANATKESCWAIIDDNVYDLTDWISSHPGRASRIIGLCGTDGTSQFQGQHGGYSSAQGTLESYPLGAVGDPLP